MGQKTSLGKLFLIPAFLGEQSPKTVFPEYNSEVIKSLSYFIVENIRTARRCIKKVCPSVVIDNLTFFELDKHKPNSGIDQMMIPLLQGNDVGILSEAGMPCIADPGNIVVALAHRQKIRVVPLIGPSSILLALIASGFNGQNFTFHGYLPIKEQRKQSIQKIEAIANTTGQTQIFMETPFRNDKLFDELIQILTPNTKLCIACDISTETEFIKTKTIKEWKANKPELHKRPAIFLIG